MPGSFDNDINTFDTADVHSNGESERLLGKASKHPRIPREEVVIMNKVFSPSEGMVGQCRFWIQTQVDKPINTVFLAR